MCDVEKTLAAQAVVFSVSGLFHIGDEVQSRIKQAFDEMFLANPNGRLQEFPFEATNGVKIACVLSPTHDELAAALAK